MPEETTIRIRVLGPDAAFLGGTVDIQFENQASHELRTIKGADASKDIDVARLQRFPNGDYKVEVIPTGTSLLVSQRVQIPPKGFPTVTFTIDKRTTTPPTNPTR